MTGSITQSRTRRDPTVGMVSLDCPNALVDSELILTQLRAEGNGTLPKAD